MRQARIRILSLLLTLVMCLGLLPVTALAAEDDVSYTITFDANGGQFPDGTTTKNLSTKKVGEENLVDGYPPEPTREGYTFEGWYRNSLGEYPSVFNYNFTADSTVKAEWGKVPEVLITFDPNGGICDVKTLPLKDGYLLEGPLPVPTKAGYTFEGWYRGYKSEADPGWKIEAGEMFTAPVAETVTAVWSKAELKPVRINFFANGGRITELEGNKVPVLTAGSPPVYFGDGSGNIGIDSNSGIGWTQTNGSGMLSSIPVAARDGYTFDGWYKLADNSKFWDMVGSNYSSEVFTNLTGQRLTSSTVNAEAATYVAKWVKVGEIFTITFDLNGATGAAPAPQKIEKGKTVNLPVLSASNAKFLGWGYSIDGENLTEWKAEYPVTRDLTLYAMWEIESDDIFSGLTYRFGNYHEAFGYTKPYYIPKERYQLVFGKIQGNSLYQYFISQKMSWGGNCYGMAATSGMFFHGNGTTTTASFRSGANVPYDLYVTDRNSSLNMTLTEYIEAVFVSQYADRIQADYGKLANLNSLASSVKTVRSTKAPVMIAIRGEAITKEGKRVDSGHAVLGYDVVEVNSTESRLMVYDPNFPNAERYITLTKSGNNYVSWAYKLNDMYDWGTGKPYSEISVVPYSDYSQVWNNRAVRSNNPAFFSTNATNASILDSTGTVVATIKNGTVSTTSSDITPILTYGVTSDGNACNSNTSSMWLPAGQYTIQTTDSSSKELEATLADVNQSATVSTSAASVTFAVNDDKALDYVQIDQSGAKYDIMLSSTLDQGHDDVHLTGTTASGGASLAQISGSLYATGIDSGTTLKVDGKSAAISSLSGAMPDIGSLMNGSAKPSGNNPFVDVKAGAYYYDAVLWAVKNGVTSGTSATTFSPDDSCTRGQIVTFLWRAAGSPKPTSGTNPFTDVKEGAYYYDAVLWAVEKGITSGTSATAFSPDTACTRGQTVTFLWRAAGSPKAAGGANPFSDVKAGTYYYDAVLWAVEKKVTSGTSATTFSPDATVTRGQTVAFLHRSQG